MMRKEVEAFLSIFKEVAGRNKKFLFYTRGIEFQKEAITELESLLKRTSDLKKKMIEDVDEDSSNILLSIENLIMAYLNELKMLIFLKEGMTGEAWKSLVEAQAALRSSFRASAIASSLEDETYTQKLHLIEHLFFPPQMFNSIAAIIERSECSICGQEYGSCNHVKGRPYMGQLCHRKITKAKIVEVSVVDIPANKMCRIDKFTDDNGNWRDFLTWRLI